jgi:hypothetical protein
MSKKTRFDLEQEIMECWTVTKDIETLYEYIGDHEFFEGMKPEHADKILNIMIGMSQLYEVKFDKLFKTFEECLQLNEFRDVEFDNYTSTEWDQAFEPDPTAGYGEQEIVDNRDTK